MTICNQGHDHDADQPPECACGEITGTQGTHHCLPIGWTTPASLLDPVTITDAQLWAWQHQEDTP